jgi:DNA helicase HerA-like ATPase
MESDPTCIGRVCHVLGSTVTVRLDPDLAGVAPIWRGRVQPLGQVGSLVLLPQGPVTVIASLTLVGISELVGDQPPSSIVQTGDRWLQVQLLGEVDALGNFHRGVSTYPALDDPVHFSAPTILQTVHPIAADSHIRIGRLSANPEVAVALEARRLVTRHSVVVGSTGSGKTSAVATILQQFVRSGWTAANVVVIDPHGEYSTALAEMASVRSVTSSGAQGLRVPYGALPAADVITALAGNPSATTINRFSELVTVERRKYADACSWLQDSEAISADTPVPFDLHEVWYRLDYENNLTVTAKTGGKDCVVDAGDARSLRPATFTPYAAAGAAPMQSTTYGRYGSAPSQMRARMRDPRYAFFLQPDATVVDHDPFREVLDEWLGGPKPISVLDFSGVPGDAADLAIGVVLQLLFELSVRSTTSAGVGRHRPVLAVMEEAHRFLGETATVRIARESVNRIAREGRKYGIGIMLVSQRPSELPDTSLSQAGTIIALRLTNAGDQARVRSGLPDTLAGLADVLPSLRTGEALVTGEAVSLPSRVLIDLPSPVPTATDPDLAGWRGDESSNDLTNALAQWRATETEDGGVP